MLKRVMLLTLCCGVTLYLSTYSFSQTPGVKEEKKTEDMSGEVKIKDDKAPAEKKEEPKPVVSALEAKTFFDGVNVYANSKVLFKLSTKDNVDVDKIEYKINDGAYQVYADAFPINEEGKKTIIFFATDKMGNKEDEKFFRVTIDNTAPVVSVLTDKPLLKVGDKIFGSKVINFSIDAKDALAGVEKTEYSIGGPNYTPYVASFNMVNDGETELKIKSTDNVTNVAEIFAIKVVDDASKQTLELKESSVKVFVDNIAPTVEVKANKELIDKSNKKIASVDYEYTITAVDNESGIQNIVFRLDGKGDFAPYKDAIKFTTNGDHLIEAKAIDRMGNVSKTTFMSVFVDVIPPVTTIDTVTTK